MSGAAPETGSAPRPDGAAAATPPDRLGAMVIGFAILAGLTVAELVVAGLDVAGRARVTALCGLLIAKVGIVLAVFSRVGARRRDPRLALAALLFASSSAAVLMLEMAFRVRQR
jgi:heme/copper-type cytochrome/quinol oxidase subunit 4